MSSPSPLARLLRRLEVPDCSCPLDWQPGCLAVGHPCAEQQEHGDCDCPVHVERCSCIDAIDPAAFPWTLDEWAEALAATWPEEYLAPIGVPPPATVLSRQARVAVMEHRQGQRLGLYHPGDLYRADLERLGQQLHQRRNGRPASGELAVPQPGGSAPRTEVA